MDPPDFKKRYEGTGLHPPLCFNCERAASHGAGLACMKYGAWVLLFSSCSAFERQERGLAIVGKEEVAGRFPFGLRDLRRSMP